MREQRAVPTNDVVHPLPPRIDLDSVAERDARGYSVVGEDEHQLGLIELGEQIPRFVDVAGTVDDVR